MRLLKMDIHLGPSYTGPRRYQRKLQTYRLHGTSWAKDKTSRNLNAWKYTDKENVRRATSMLMYNIQGLGKLVALNIR